MTKQPSIRGLLDRLLTWAGRRECLDIVDLGAGTGSTMRRLAPLLGIPQRWTLVELDPALIGGGSRDLPAGTSYRRLDLARELGEVARLPAGADHGLGADRSSLGGMAGGAGGARTADRLRALRRAHL